MAAWRTVIVEDSPAVAEVHRRLVASVPGFVIVGMAPTAAETRRLVALHHPHLLVLDLGLPDGDGLSLLRALRGAREPVEVIAVTAARGAQVVRDCVHLGVVDYLVKPFAPERLRQALGLFAHRMQALHDGELAQARGRSPVRQRAQARPRAAARPRARDAGPGPRPRCSGGGPLSAARGRRARRRSPASRRAATSSTSPPRARRTVTRPGRRPGPPRQDVRAFVRARLTTNATIDAGARRLASVRFKERAQEEGPCHDSSISHRRSTRGWASIPAT